MFYPNLKEYISPSALATWFNSKPSFIESYFKGVKMPETSAMKAGNKIHALIEGGFYDPQKRYDLNEKELSHMVADTGVKSFGKPDSFGLVSDGHAEFVDYKTGREVSWSRDELKNDVKMKQTAWLVWKETGMPDKVTGYIEWIGTEWNGTEVVPSIDEYMLVKCDYTAQELNEWENVIIKAIGDINEAYEKFVNSSELFIDEDLCKQYAKLNAEIKEIEEKQIEILKVQREELGEQIATQLAMSDAENHKTEYGSFFWKVSKKYAYPDDLEFQTNTGVYSLALGEEIVAGVKACKKGYEKFSKPVEEKKSLQFRASKKK